MSSIYFFHHQVVPLPVCSIFFNPNYYSSTAQESHSIPIDSIYFHHSFYLRRFNIPSKNNLARSYPRHCMLASIRLVHDPYTILCEEVADWDSYVLRTR